MQEAYLKEINILLETRNVCKDFVIRRITGQRAIHALGPVSLSVHKGCSIAIIGESGSGKTTLGLILAGLIKQTSGEVFFKGTPLGIAVKKRGFRKSVQIVFQNPFDAVDPLYTIKEYLEEALPLSFKRLPKKERREKILSALDAVGLSGQNPDKFPAELSGGQLQRVCIARSLLPGPEVLIMDEPTSALDKRAEGRIIGLIKKLQMDMRFSLVFITHDLNLAREIADGIVLLRNGTIVEAADTGEFFNGPKSEYGKRLLLSRL